MSVETNSSTRIAAVPDVLDDLLTRTPGAAAQAAAQELANPIEPGVRFVDTDPLCQEYADLAALTYLGSEDPSQRRQTFLDYMHLAQRTLGITGVTGTPRLDDGFPEDSDTPYAARFEDTINSSFVYFMGTEELPDSNPAAQALMDALESRPPADPKNIGLAAIGFQMGIFMGGLGQRQARILEQEQQQFPLEQSPASKG